MTEVSDSSTTRPFTIAIVVAAVIATLLGGCSGAGRGRSSPPGGTPTTRAGVTAATTTAVRQPPAAVLPAPPKGVIGTGSRGPIVLAYQRRLKELHFDPGPLDGVYSADTAYAVVTVEKLFGLSRDGEIGPEVQAHLEHFTYRPALPNTEADRVEIDLDTQVLTVYHGWQPILVTTTSTGSGAYFCGGNDGCQYAITPTGHFRFQALHEGWDTGKLGRMWNPYYFDGGIAVHGLPSVPSYPASHGCARIPMDIANYFPSLVTTGESVYVIGTAMKPGDRYVGPTTTTVAATTTSTTIGPTGPPTTRTPTTTVPPAPRTPAARAPTTTVPPATRTPATRTPTTRTPATTTP